MTLGTNRRRGSEVYNSQLNDMWLRAPPAWKDVITPLGQIWTRPFCKIQDACVVIEREMAERDSVIYLTPSPADWLPILSERLPQYEMQTHPLGVLITRKESNDVG